MLPGDKGLRDPLICLTAARFGISFGSIGATRDGLEATLRDAAELQIFDKLNNIRESLKIARECRTILGAAGITLEWPMMRHANNLESVLTYEGTFEVHQLVIGKALTGQDAFR